MTSVLQKLSLVAYRGISDLVLDGLTPVSLVVGANNSGKSSILEAAGLLLRPPDPTQWATAVRHRDIDMSIVDGIQSLFPDQEDNDLGAGFGEGSSDGSGSGSGAGYADGSGNGSGDGSGAGYGDSSGGGRGDGSGAGYGNGRGDGNGAGHEGGKRPIELAAELTGASRVVLAKCWSAPIMTDEGVEQGGVRVEVVIDGAPGIILKFPGPAVPHQVPIYRVFTVTPATHYSTKALVEHLSRVVDEGKKQLAVDLLQLFDANVEDLDVIASQGREAVRVTHRTRGVVDLASFGDGMRRSAALALALTRASQGVLLVDEIEAGIHPNALRPVFSKLLEAAAASRVQILATTHSLEAVDAIIGSFEDSGTPDALSAFWVQRQESGHEVRRYDFAKLCTLREGGLDIR